MAGKVLCSCSLNYHTTNVGYLQIIIFRLRNDLYSVGWGVKLYSLTLQIISSASQKTELGQNMLAVELIGHTMELSISSSLWFQDTAGSF